jgi:hypothetical protein
MGRRMCKGVVEKAFALEGMLEYGMVVRVGWPYS